jgi:uncharacterized protein (DUF305 family)
MTRTLTRRAALTGAALLAGVVLSACGSNDSGSHNGPMPGMRNNTNAPASNAAAAAFGDADVAFAQQMIPHHQQAVSMAALADTRAADPEVKKLAGQIKAAQDPEIATMTGWLTTWGKPMPMSSTDHGMDMGGGTAMPGMMSGADMTKLAAATGKNFDKEFLTMMIAHHEGAITMAKDQVSTGKNADAIALAKQISTAQEAEIATMKTILARL